MKLWNEGGRADVVAETGFEGIVRASVEAGRSLTSEEYGGEDEIGDEMGGEDEEVGNETGAGSDGGESLGVDGRVFDLPLRTVSDGGAQMELE